MRTKTTVRNEAIRQMLAEGRHSLSSGRVVEVAALVRAHPKRASLLFECLWDDDEGVASRAADSVERLTRDSAELLAPWKAPLLGLLTEAAHKKLRWILAVTIPRLTLSLAECQRVAGVLESHLDDASSIVKTAALQGLADLTRQNTDLLPSVLDLLRMHSRSGTAAMRARSRILLRKLESPPARRAAKPSHNLSG
jgi:hypothetical protein